MAHMGPANLNLRMAAGQVAPHGWLAGAAFRPLLEFDRQAGTKRLGARAHLYLPRLPFTLSRCRERERRKRKVEFRSKKLAKIYLVEDDESVSFGLGWRVCFATLTNGAG